MNKKIALFAFLGLFVAILAVSAQTSTPTEPPSTSSDTADMSKNSKMVGTIDKVDPLAKTISVKLDKSGEVRVFTYDDKTSFRSMDDKSIQFETLKAGDRVGIEADAANLATKIKIKSGDKTKDPNEKE